MTSSNGYFVASAAGEGLQDLAMATIPWKQFSALYRKQSFRLSFC
jgi:hypothetical protein